MARQRRVALTVKLDVEQKDFLIEYPGVLKRNYRGST